MTKAGIPRCYTLLDKTSRVRVQMIEGKDGRFLPEVKAILETVIVHISRLIV